MHKKFESQRPAVNFPISKTLDQNKKTTHYFIPSNATTKNSISGPVYPTTPGIKNYKITTLKPARSTATSSSTNEVIDLCDSDDSDQEDASKTKVINLKSSSYRRNVIASPENLNSSKNSSFSQQGSTLSKSSGPVSLNAPPVKKKVTKPTEFKRTVVGDKCTIDNCGKIFKNFTDLAKHQYLVHDVQQYKYLMDVLGPVKQPETLQASVGSQKPNQVQPDSEKPAEKDLSDTLANILQHFTKISNQEKIKENSKSPAPKPKSPEPETNNSDKTSPIMLNFEDEEKFIASSSNLEDFELADETELPESELGEPHQTVVELSEFYERAEPSPENEKTDNEKSGISPEPEAKKSSNQPGLSIDSDSFGDQDDFDQQETKNNTSSEDSNKMEKSLDRLMSEINKNADEGDDKLEIDPNDFKVLGQLIDTLSSEFENSKGALEEEGDPEEPELEKKTEEKSKDVNAKPSEIICLDSD